jgi:hypothetical protein
MAEHPSLAQQFRGIIEKRGQDVSKKVSGDVAAIFEERMKDNTEQGRGFENDQYDSTYSKSHTRARRREGLQTGRVDLRYKNRRIEETRVETTGGRRASATIRFSDGGDIFKLHHEGRAKGDKTRSIWPKSPQSVPDDIKRDAKRLVGEVLRGG